MSAEYGQGWRHLVSTRIEEKSPWVCYADRVPTKHTSKMMDCQRCPDYGVMSSLYYLGGKTHYNKYRAIIISEVSFLLVQYCMAMLFALTISLDIP